MPTPDDPRIANLFVLLLGGAMGWLFSVGLRRYLPPDRSTLRRELWYLLAWGYLWAVVLLVNGAVAAASLRTWEAVARRPPLDSVTALEGADNGAEVLLVGRARAAPGSSGEPARAYLVEYDSDGRRWGDGGDLLVELAGGARPVTGLATVHPWNWSYRRGHHTQSWLADGDPVAILGTIRHATGMAGSERGVRAVSVEAALVRRGSHADFVAAAEAQSRRLWPRSLAWASLGTAAVLALLPLRHWIRRLRGRGPAG